MSFLKFRRNRDRQHGLSADGRRFATANAPGLRTSPVKRGYWVVRRVLGETIPPPPPGVPELPRDEAKLGELTLPQLLAWHREARECAWTAGICFCGHF